MESESESVADAETREAQRLTRSTTPPKLSLFSRIPHQSPPEPSPPTGMLTPPLRPPASVPFRWEEAPGKPLSTATSLAVARCLELPPRLQLTESSIYNNKIYSTSSRTLSPTTVLDGPYVGHGRSPSFTSSSLSRDPLPPPPTFGSFRREGSPEDSEGGRILQGRDSSNFGVGGKGYFGSWGRKVSSSSSSSSSKWNQDVGEVSFTIYRSSAAVVHEVGIEETSGNTNTKVKITSFRRTGSFLGIPYTKSSQFWASIYEGIKQVVPWRNRKTKKNGFRV